MTNGECIYRKRDDYMSRMALEKDDFKKVSSNLEISCYGKLGCDARCIKDENGPLKSYETILLAKLKLSLN